MLDYAATTNQDWTPMTQSKVTLTTLREMKARKEPITWLTAYDYPTARLMDAAGIDMVLVGDSLGMTVLGFDTTLPVTMEHMVVFTAAVSRGPSAPSSLATCPFSRTRRNLPRPSAMRAG